MTLNQGICILAGWILRVLDPTENDRRAVKHSLSHYFFSGLRLLLIPVMLWAIIGVSVAGSKLILKIGYSYSLHFIGIGFCCGLVLFSLISPFMRMYIIGHELTHWFIAKIFKRKTGKLRFGPTNGSVKIQRPNVWIVLAPYFFPFYMVVWTLVISLIQIWVTTRWLIVILYCGIGITYSYHLVMTVLALSKGQSDLKIYGQSFSLCLILLINFLIFYCALSFYSDNVDYSRSLLRKTYQAQWFLFNRVF